MQKFFLTMTMACILAAGCEHGTYSERFATEDDKKDSNGGSSTGTTTGTQSPAPQASATQPAAPASNNDFLVGRWKLTSTADGSSWYAFFSKDYSWRIADKADGSSMRVYGTYTVSGNTAKGNMINPGVGTGNIYVTVNGSTMTFDFEEHWHSPYKTIRYSGQKQ